MRKSIIITFLSLLLYFTSIAQIKNVSSFVPEGYMEFEKYFGDLNKDGLEDCVLVIKKTDRLSIITDRFNRIVDRNRRGIIILFKTQKTYTIADSNYDCFSSENEDGGIYFAPELSIEIENSKLKIHYGHGRYGYWNYTFRFQNERFMLIGYDHSSNTGPVTNSEVSINFLTKKKLKKINTNLNSEGGGDEHFIEKWSKIKMEKLIRLSDIKDFDALDFYNF